MNCLIHIFVLISTFGYFNIASGSPTRDDDTLVLVHALFRHGNRVPNSQAYSNNPINNESYYPEGYGQLTNEGKRTEYRIGTTLRERYNRFLGPTWNINDVDARTTNVNRTKMSLLLVLGGLFPPVGEQRFQPWLKWQPVPYNYLTSDKELSGTNVCSNYDTLLSAVEDSDEITEALSVYEQYYDYIVEKSGDEFTGPEDAFSLYFEQTAQEDYGYPLEDWVKEVRDVLEKMTKDVYYLGTNTTDLKKIAGGYLTKKIINDSKAKIDGLLTPQSRKMFLYSAHEKNVANFLLTLGVFDDKIPAYGAHVLVELHLIRGVYGFKIYHQDWTTKNPRLLTIPGCQAFCPYDDFVSLLAEVIPDDDFCETS